MFSREHRIQEGKVVFPLGVSVQGDVVVSVYHMRSTIGGRLQAKVKFVCFILWLGVKMGFSIHHPSELILQIHPYIFYSLFPFIQF